MRIRLPLRRGIFFGVMLLLALLALLPMRLALDWFDTGLTARRVDGSVWLGRLTEARAGDAPLGDLSARLSPIQMFVGRARVDVKNEAGIDGAVSVSRNSVGVDDMTAVVPVSAVFSPLPIETLDLTDVSARFRDGQCANAEGRVRAALSGEIAGMNLTQGLTGNARCEGGALLLPLQGQSGMERLGIKLFEDGRYELDLTVQPGDPALGARLAEAGFRQTARGFVFSLQGRL